MTQTNIYIRGHYSTENLNSHDIKRNIDEEIVCNHGMVCLESKLVQESLLIRMKHDLKSCAFESTCNGSMVIKYVDIVNGEITKQHSSEISITSPYDLELFIKFVKKIASAPNPDPYQAVKEQLQSDSPSNVSLLPHKPAVSFSHKLENGCVKRSELSVSEDGPTTTCMQRLSRLCCFW